MLVHSRLVCERVATHDGLVGLHRKAQHARKRLAGGINALGVNAGGKRQPVAAHLERHYDLLQRSVSGALSDAIDRAFHLARPRFDGRQRIGDRQAEVVMAVHRDGDVLDAAHLFPNGADQRRKFCGNGVADGVGDIQRGGAGFDHCFQHLAEIAHVGAGSVLRRELNLIAQGSRVADGLHCLTQRLLARNLQLELQMDIGRGQEDMDARPPGVAERFPSTINVLAGGARQPRDRGPAHPAGHRLHRAEVAVGRDGKTRLDHVHPEGLQVTRHQDLLFQAHAAAGRLLAVAERGIKDGDACLLHVLPPLLSRRARERQRNEEA